MCICICICKYELMYTRIQVTIDRHEYGGDQRFDQTYWDKERDVAT